MMGITAMHFGFYDFRFGVLSDFSMAYMAWHICLVEALELASKVSMRR
jgi:hypothetical protein